MTDDHDTPDPILSFLHSNGEALELGELDQAFLKSLGIGPAGWERPFRVALSAQTSRYGNTFYSYAQAAVPLPDGIDTELTLNELQLTGAEPSLSKKGNPTRRFVGRIDLHGMPYDVVAYITKTASPYWIKVHAQRARKSRQGEVGTGPIGGKLV